MSLDKKEGQLVTKAKIKRADSAKLKGIATNKLYCGLTVLCSEIANFLNPQNVVRHLITINNYLLKWEILKLTKYYKKNF